MNTETIDSASKANHKSETVLSYFWYINKKEAVGGAMVSFYFY